MRADIRCDIAKYKSECAAAEALAAARDAVVEAAKAWRNITNAEDAARTAHSAVAVAGAALDESHGRGRKAARSRSPTRAPTRSPAGSARSAPSPAVSA